MYKQISFEKNLEKKSETLVSFWQQVRTTYGHKHFHVKRPILYKRCIPYAVMMMLFLTLIYKYIMGLVWRLVTFKLKHRGWDGSLPILISYIFYIKVLFIQISDKLSFCQNSGTSRFCHLYDHLEINLFSTKHLF